MTTPEKDAGNWPAREFTGYRRALRIIGTIILSVFLAETAVMFLLAFLPPMGRVQEAFLDASILVVLLSPALYFFLLQPLLQHIRAQATAEADLRRSQRMLQTVFEGISEPLILLDDTCRVKMLNSAACDYFQVKTSDVLGRECREAFRKEFEACGECLIPGSVHQAVRVTTFDRNSPIHARRFEQVAVYQARGADGERGAVIMRISDITEAKMMERHMVHREKMAALGLLISSVAHEINNPNNFIIFNLPILRDYVNVLLPIVDIHRQEHGDGDFLNMSYAEFRKDIDSLIDNIEHGAHRINSIVSQLKEFSRLRNRQTARPMNPKSVIEKAVNICSGEVNRRVTRFDVEMPDDLPMIRSDEEALEQILINLLINAAQAADKPEAWVRLRAEAGDSPEDRLRLSVSDNGCGMDEETRNQIFDPLFTTKDTQNGTGLGLYVCLNLIESLGGRIEVSSRLGEGTEIRILLPDVSEKSLPEPAAATE
ncbi:MAG: two-component system sensor histidine kinase NtrB [Desulfobacterales bacterium]